MTDYGKVMGLTLNKLLAGGLAAGTEQLETAMCQPRRFDVLTLDRSHVTCLADAGVCEGATHADAPAGQ